MCLVLSETLEKIIVFGQNLYLSNVFSVFTKSEKLIVFGQKSVFPDATLCTPNPGERGKTYLCFSRHLVCNPINPLWETFYLHTPLSDSC